MASPLPANEQERLAVLREYRILDTAAEMVFEDITRLVAFICRVPMATISLVDEGRQWFKSRIGVEAQETPRDVSFCAHAIMSKEPMVVGDARRDGRFCESPLVKEVPHIRFYAGFPLVAPEGVVVGTLCALDNKPRRMRAKEKQAMQALARQVVALLELRRVSAELALSLEQVKTLRGLLPMCAWCKRIRDDHGFWTRVEAYVQAHTEADFTHGICPECAETQRKGAEKAREEAAAAQYCVGL